MTRARVITVDDEPMITELIRFKLKAAGIECDVAGSAEEGLRLMQQNLYFVVIADIHMPGMSGVELVSALKEVSPLVQVIMLTADATPEQVIACADRGAIDFFSKYEDCDAIVESAKTVLSRRERWSAWLGKSRRQPVAAE